MNALFLDSDSQAQRISAWAERTLRPAATRYEAMEETAGAITAVRPKAKVIPTQVLVQDEVEKYLAIAGEPPKAVVMHPLRLLALASYDEERYTVAGHEVVLRTRSGLEVDQLYGTSFAIETAKIATLDA